MEDASGVQNSETQLTFLNTLHTDSTPSSSEELNALDEALQMTMPEQPGHVLKMHTSLLTATCPWCCVDWKYDSMVSVVSRQLLLSE